MSVSVDSSALRMQKYRLQRIKVLETIVEPSVKNIATILDTMLDGHDYVLVPNAVSNKVRESMIKLTGEVLPINFNANQTSKRSMQAVENPDYCISDILKSIRIVFEGCTAIIVKLLKSKAGDPEQATHTDFCLTEATPSSKRLREFHYSGVISIMDNTKLLIGESRDVVDIPLHSMIFFRGDLQHAGAGYPARNSRIFVSASSKPFPATEDVFFYL